MATNPQDTPAAAAPPAGGGEKAAESAPSPSSGGGVKAWLPLIVTVVTMPALAYCTTAFVLMPRLQKQVAAAAASIQPASTNTNSNAHGAETKAAIPTPAKNSEKGGEKSKEAGATEATLKERGAKVTSNGKMTVPLNKILVNIAGSMGSRYLMAGLTLASDKEGFGEVVLNNEAQLLDVAASVLSSKTIADLEKPEARTVVRSELQTVFNNALGAGTVEDVYLTEFAIQ
jgi:flagellar FliL protein